MSVGYCNGIGHSFGLNNSSHTLPTDAIFAACPLTMLAFEGKHFNAIFRICYIYIENLQ